MALDITFAKFDAIASGDYNAGQIDFKGSGSNATLKKVNAHVHFTSLNTATIDAKHVVELKRAFVQAMESKLGGDKEAIAAIRKSLGLPPDDTVPRALSARTIEPLTRQEVREIIDKYVKRTGGANSRPVDANVAAQRDAVNLQNQRALPIRPMPPAANPGAAPKTLVERKRALLGALPVYGAHEQKGGFDYGRNMHGRGHATRVFIFANVLGNIMRERGVAVDMGSLSTSAAGHDMGRQGSGTDVWEKDSGNLVAQLADQTYPGAYGDDWKAQTKLNVSAGHGAQADAQRSVEGLLMKAADSLDYTRVAPLNEKRFHFLEKTLKVGGVHVMRDDVLRKALLHEAELLSKATDPLAANREEITRLKASEDEVKRLQGQALEVETTKAEIALSQLTDEQLVEQIEAEIRGNPAKYPLLTKYYLNGDSIA